MGVFPWECSFSPWEKVPEGRMRGEAETSSHPPSPQPSPASGRGGQSGAIKILVGAKVDKKSSLINESEISNLVKECGFAAFLDLSAKTGRNTRRLRKLISDALDWDQMAKTSRPELFQHIVKQRAGDQQLAVENGIWVASNPQPTGLAATTCQIRFLRLPFSSSSHDGSAERMRSST